MNRIKTAALFAASVTGLALSAATFAAAGTEQKGAAADTSVTAPGKANVENHVKLTAAADTEYKDAVSAAKSGYKSAIAACKDMKSDERSNCMKDAKAEQKLAMNKAHDMRGEAKATGKMGKESGETGDKPVTQGADKAIDKSAPQAKPADKVTK